MLILNLKLRTMKVKHMMKVTLVKMTTVLLMPPQVRFLRLPVVFQMFANQCQRQRQRQRQHQRQRQRQHQRQRVLRLSPNHPRVVRVITVANRNHRSCVFTISQKQVVAPTQAARGLTHIVLLKERVRMALTVAGGNTVGSLVPDILGSDAGVYSFIYLLFLINHTPKKLKFPTI
jgi:hypothetical protein